MEPPSKKPRKFMEDSESDSDSDSQGGVSVAPDAGFKINEDYARRFEYNKKREERQQCTLIKTHDSFRLTDTDD
jgi:protein KRI1